MKPTQQQIDAALAYASDSSTDEQYALLRNQNAVFDADMAAMEILAAAYREAMAENEVMRKQLSAQSNPIEWTQ